jgi:hypothetical protein
MILYQNGAEMMLSVENEVDFVLTNFSAHLLRLSISVLTNGACRSVKFAEGALFYKKSDKNYCISKMGKHLKWAIENKELL